MQWQSDWCTKTTLQKQSNIAPIRALSSAPIKKTQSYIFVKDSKVDWIRLFLFKDEAISSLTRQLNLHVQVLPQYLFMSFIITKYRNIGITRLVKFISRTYFLIYVSHIRVNEKHQKTSSWTVIIRKLAAMAPISWSKKSTLLQPIFVSVLKLHFQNSCSFCTCTHLLSISTTSW